MGLRLIGFSDFMIEETKLYSFIAGSDKYQDSNALVFCFEHVDIISLITGWTVYTEKYKARGPDRPKGGLYGGPRDLYFSYRQSNQLLRSLLPD